MPVSSLAGDVVTPAPVKITIWLVITCAVERNAIQPPVYIRGHGDYAITLWPYHTSCGRIVVLRPHRTHDTTATNGCNWRRLRLPHPCYDSVESGNQLDYVSIRKERTCYGVAGGCWQNARVHGRWLTAGRRHKEPNVYNCWYLGREYRPRDDADLISSNSLFDCMLWCVFECEFVFVCRMSGLFGGGGVWGSHYMLDTLHIFYMFIYIDIRLHILYVRVGVCACVIAIN